MSSTINEREQMLFISTDEGTSFLRQPLSFTVETLLFHPKEEDKLLAYSKEGKASRSRVATAITLGKPEVLFCYRAPIGCRPIADKGREAFRAVITAQPCLFDSSLTWDE